MRRTGTPGVAVGILNAGRAQAGGFGVTNTETPAAVDEYTLFQIGSTTKTVTATAVLRLVEQGLLDLDIPVRRWIRDLTLKDQDVARRVNLRHLLTHTGGWAGDFFSDTGRGDDALSTVVTRMRGIPQLTPLGDAWHYNNAGFYLAGLVIERVTGKTFEAAISDLLFAPLGMQRSFFFADEAITFRVASGHVAKGTKQSVVRPWPMSRSVGPAGGIISDTIDQLMWARFHLGDGRAPDGKRLLKRSNLREMQRPQAPAGSMADSVGISWLLRDVDGARFVAHGGTTSGQLSAFLMVPERNFAITVLTNSTRGGEVHLEVVRFALRHLLGIRWRDPKPLRFSTAEVRAFEGRYRDGFRTFDFELRARAGRLRGTFVALTSEPSLGVLPPIELAFYDTDRAFVVEGRLKGSRAEFIRDERGRIRWMRIGGRLLRRGALSGR